MKKKGLRLESAFLLFLIISLSLWFYSCQKDEGKREFLKEGSPVPHFILRAADGTSTWTVADGRGSIVIINFWATWCPSCREEMPSMQRFYKKFNGNGVRLLTVLFRDDPFQALGFLKEMHYDFPVYVDPEYRAAQIFGLTGVPETYIIDREGRLLQRIIGPFDWESPDFAEYINRLKASTGASRKSQDFLG